MASVIEKVLRAGEGRILKKLKTISKNVNELEGYFEDLTDDELQQKRQTSRKRFSEGEAWMI